MVNINKSSNFMLQHHHYDNDLWKNINIDDGHNRPEV